MKQHQIPEQNLQLHRCENLTTECQSMLVSSATMRSCVITEHAQCEADNAISQVNTLPNKIPTDDSEDTDNEMKNCSR
jgi:hypothetical protein